MSERKPCIPLYTDLTDRKVMVAGTGPEAQELIRYLSAYTDHLYLLTGKVPETGHAAAEESPEDADCSGGAVILGKDYERSDLYGMDYVVSVLQDEAVNEDIFVTCRTLGIRVSIPSCPARCDFFLRM